MDACGTITRRKKIDQVCRYWQQGICNRNPCTFLHADAAAPSQTLLRKRQNPSSEQRESKKRYTWTRNALVSTPISEPEPEPDNKKLCPYWATGNCVHGENCRHLHSFFTGSGIKFVANLEGHKKAVTGVSFPGGSDKLFSGSSDGCFHVWDCKSGQCVFGADLGTQIGCIISEAPWLFVGVENSVKVWNLDHHTLFHLTGANGLVRSLSYDPDVEDGAILYGGFQDGSALVWKVTPESTLPVDTYKGHQQPVLSLFIGKGVIYSAFDRQVEDDSGVLALQGIYDKDCNPILLCSRADNTVRLLYLPTFTERGRVFTKGAVHTISVETISIHSSRLFFIGDATGQLVYPTFCMVISMDRPDTLLGGVNPR